MYPNITTEGIIAKDLLPSTVRGRIFFLLKDHIANLSHTIIDREYLGKDDDIRRYLMNLLTRAKYTASAEQFHFGHIGKGSTAHSLAIDTLRGKEQPNVKLTLEDILGQF